MAGPLMSAPVAAQQIAQTQLKDQGLQQQPTKQAASKFDGLMADKAQAAQAPGQVNATSQVNAAQAAQKAQAASAAQKVDVPRHIEAANRADRANTRAVNENVPADVPAPVESSNQITGILSDIEKGQGLMDKLINGGLSGKSFSNSELLALQAGMYKYTQELELTGKVVEKATTGLKDTLKTQV